MRPKHPVIANVDLNTQTVTPAEPVEVTRARFHAICDKWKEATGTVHPAISALARACSQTLVAFIGSAALWLPMAWIGGVI